MGVCRKAQTEIRGNKETSDTSPIMSSLKNSSSKFSIKHNDYNSEITSDKAANISQRSHNVELNIEENFGK